MPSTKRVILVKDGKIIKEADMNDLPPTLRHLTPLTSTHMNDVFINKLGYRHDVELYERVYVNEEQNFGIYLYSSQK
jgi:hypothetical protein